MIESIAGSFADLVKIIVPIAISAVIGNYLVQRWQQRNWRQQQLVLRGEKDLEALKLVIDDFMKLADCRSYRSRRALLQLQRSSVIPPEGSYIPEKVKKDYISSVVTWNEKFNSMCVRLTMYAPGYCSQILESHIQPQFVEISSRIENLLKSKSVTDTFFKKQKVETERLLNALNGSIGELCKELIRKLKEREKINYLGKEIRFEEHTIEQFSTWQLVEALFKSQKPTLTVFGPSQDVCSPSFWGD